LLATGESFAQDTSNPDAIRGYRVEVRELEAGASRKLVVLSRDELHAVISRLAMLDSVAYGRYRCGQLVVDFQARRVFLGEGEVRLTAHEYAVLADLARNAGTIRSIRGIFESVWQRPFRNQSAYVWTYIRRLRQKLEADPRHPVYLLSRNTLGYVLPKPDSTELGRRQERNGA
jgi:DNA-binding response OmpR family regulator